MPGYAFMPDGKSLIVPIGGKLQRVDFETGQARVIPMTVNVAAEIAPRVYTPVRVEDGPTVRARLVRWPGDVLREREGSTRRSMREGLRERESARGWLRRGSVCHPARDRKIRFRYGAG